MTQHNSLTTLVIVIIAFNISHDDDDENETNEHGYMANDLGLIMYLFPISNNFLSSIKMYAMNLTHDAQIVIWQVPLATVLVFIFLRNEVKSQK